MKKMLTLFSVLIVSLCFASAAFAQAVYYVQSVKAKVLSGGSFKSPVLGEVPKGHQFTSLGKEGGWIKVRYKEKVGYVSALVLSTHPPFARPEVIRAEDSEIKSGVRRRASSYTSAAAARGLAQDDRRRLGSQVKADYDSVDKMESFTVSQDELNRFMEGGKP